MAKIYLLLVMSNMQPVSWALPAAYWSMDQCVAAKEKRFPQGNSEAICMEFTSEKWR